MGNEEFPIVSIKLEYLYYRWEHSKFDQEKNKHVLRLYTGAVEQVRNGTAYKDRPLLMLNIYNSIRNIGMVNPLIVKEVDNTHYYVVIGNQRLSAIRLLKELDINSYNKWFPNDDIACRIAAPEHVMTDMCQVRYIKKYKFVDGIDKEKCRKNFLP